MDEYSLFRYAIESAYIHKLNSIKWFQFNKRKEANKWREDKLKKSSNIMKYKQ